MAPPGIKLVQKVSSTRTFGRLAPHVIPALDRTVHRLTRGKVLLSAQMLPGVILSVRGAKSGSSGALHSRACPRRSGGPGC